MQKIIKIIWDAKSQNYRADTWGRKMNQTKRFSIYSCTLWLLSQLPSMEGE